MRAKMSRRRFVAGSITLAAASSLVPLGPIATAAQGRLGITAAERRTLRATANVLIPAEGRMPVASAVGVVSYVETIAAKDRKVHELLVGGLRAIESAAGRTRLDGLTADQQLAVLSRIEKTDSPAGFFPLLRDLVYEAYYTHPRVMKLVGYRFRSGRRRTAALEPFDEARLVRVRAMKPLYRDVRP